MKQCKLCHQQQPIEDFGKNNTQDDGLHYYCKACIKMKTERNKDKNKAYYKEWSESNKDYLSDYQKSYRKKNRDKLNEYQRNRPLEKKRKSNCSEKKKLREKTRRQTEVYKRERNKYFKDKYYADIQFKIKKQLEARLRSLMLKNDTTVKSVKLIDCTIPEFKRYLESKFLPTMTWENYGELWEMDRIIPFCEFDLTQQEEQKKCMHYTNVQPMFKTTMIIEGVEYLGNLNKNRY